MNTQAKSVPGMPVIPPGWRISVDPKTEWHPTDPAHPAFGFLNTAFPKYQDIDLTKLPESIWRVSIPILYVEDAVGHALRYVILEPRIEREVKGDPDAPVLTMANNFLLHRPNSLILFEEGKYEEAMVDARKWTSPLNERTFLRAREKLETAAAFEAFKVLFQHYSFNEELWRLEKWMADSLPFDLEEHPGMEHYRQLLDKQLGHLRTDGKVTVEALARHYAVESPIAGVDESYVELAKATLPERFRWLIEVCRERGYKRVAEFGSVEGISLFHLIPNAPDIEWHGFESSDVAVKRGRELAAKTGVEKFNLHPMHDEAGGFGYGPYVEFDGVALFEALEHNHDLAGLLLVLRCMRAIRPGGSLFITTPHGNWSGFDAHTRDLELRKDHINAFTPKRMEKFLTECMASSFGKWKLTECRSVENPTVHENNRWVMARVERES